MLSTPYCGDEDALRPFGEAALGPLGEAALGLATGAVPTLSMQLGVLSMLGSAVASAAASALLAISAVGCVKVGSTADGRGEEVEATAGKVGSVDSCAVGDADCC